MKTANFCFVIGFAIILGACASENNGQNELGYTLEENPEYGIFQNDETPAFRLVLQDSILVDTSDDFVISRIRYLDTDQAGNIYFLETAQSKLISFSADGIFRWMTGEQGRGPGDFDRPTHLLAGEQNLYIVNLAGTRLDLFNFEGNFMQSISLGKELLLPKLRGFTNNSQLIITTPLWQKIGSNVYMTTLAGDSLIRQNQFELNRSGEKEFGTGNNAASEIRVEGNELVAGSKTDYSVSRYDLEGNLLSKVTRDFDRIVPPGYHDDGDYAMFTGFGGVEFIGTLPVGYFITFSLWPANVTDPDDHVKRSMQGNAERVEFMHSIDVFSSENRLLYSFEGDGLAPPQGELSHIDGDGILYFIKENPEAVIYRYNLIQN